MTGGNTPEPAERPRFWRYGLLALLLIIPALIVQMPSSVMAYFIPKNLPVEIEAFGGTVWNGQVRINQAGESIQLQWRLKPLQLLSAKVSLDVEAQGALNLRGQLAYGLAGLGLTQLNGAIPSRVAAPYLPRGWSVPGELIVEGVDVFRVSPMSGEWRHADGLIRWQGGELSFNLNGQQQSAQVPPVALSLAAQDGALNLALDQQQGGALALLSLSASNLLETQVRHRLLSYSSSYRGQGSPDQVVVSSKQQL